MCCGSGIRILKNIPSVCGVILFRVLEFFVGICSSHMQREKEIDIESYGHNMFLVS